MANMLECKKCGEVKDYSQFSKKTKSKTGYQDRCKACNKIDNHKFRTEINPEHHSKWQKQNKQIAAAHVTKWRKGDKAGIVYALINPKGETYIGQTKTYLSVRMMEHRVKYKRYIKGKSTLAHPLLFQSFEKYGIENHKLEILYLDKDISRQELKKIEKDYIQQYKQINKSLNKIL